MSKSPCLLLLLFSFVSKAESVTVIRQENNRVIIHSDIGEYTEPTNQKQTIQSILADSIQQKFVVSELGIGSYFMSHTGHWDKFTIKSETNNSLILEVHNIAIDEVDCYAVNGNVIALPPVNWQVPSEQREIKSYRNVFLLPIDSGETLQVYLRLKKNTGTLRTDFSIWQQEAFNKDTDREFVISGFLSGVFLFIILLCLLLFISTTDAKYIYYSLYVLSVMLWRFTMEGYLLIYMSGHFPAYSNPSYGNMWLITAAVFSAMFLKSFALNKEKSPAWHFRLANLNVVLVGLFFLFFLLFGLDVFSSKLLGWFYYLLFTIFIFNGFLFSISGMKRGETNAYIYFFSNVGFLLYSVIIVATNAGLLPNFFLFSFSIMWVLFAEIIILCIGLGIDFRRQLLQRKNLLLEVSEQQRIALEANNKLQQQTIKTIKAENILRNEKERISSDLHDSIGSDLSNIIYNLDYISNKLKDSPQVNDVQQLQQFSRNTMDQLRSAIWVLNQEKVSVDDFCTKLHSYVSKQLNNHQNLNYGIETSEDTRTYILPTSHALYLYRIIQEALNNTMKYANASFFKIQFEKFDNEKLLVTINDNGIGFSSESTTKKESYGLENMAKRIESLQGEFSISSESGEGTIIKISIPIII